MVEKNFLETVFLACGTLDDIIEQVTVLVGCLNINPVWCKIHTGFFVSIEIVKCFIHHIGLKNFFIFYKKSVDK